uniref:5'-nucleotidase n=1 Tax=Strigamia maritima TaxID=126957 RepID=T1JP15_STRMM
MTCIQELQRSAVKIKDPNLIEEKICKLIKGGQAKLQVIADFDNTLSRFHFNGKRCDSSHGAIETNPRMPVSFRKKTKALVEKYYPIEADPNISIDIKMPFIVEWYSSGHQALCETKLKKSDLKTIVQESAVLLRDGCQTFLQTLHEHGVLLIIFSAGLGNVIEEAIHQQACMYENIHIMSNFMLFDNDGLLMGFNNELVHTCNKNGTTLSKMDCYSECLEKPCIILLGDSIGDINMVAGLPSAEVTLKIGFLNDNVEPSIQKYLDNYDVVLVNDQTMDVVNAILRKIL